MMEASSYSYPITYQCRVIIILLKMIQNQMGIFVLPNNTFTFCYFYIPPVIHFQTEKPLFQQPEVHPSYHAEILKPNSQQKQQICLTKEDLEAKGYEQNKRPWTEKEDRLLLKLCEDQNARFQEIAKQIPGRNAKMCYSRYRRLTNQVKQSWTEEENSRLERLVKQKGQNWKEIAPFFKKRTDKQLKDHYLNYLRPNLNKGEWSLEEDMRLISLINAYGTDWKIIQQNMPDRSRNHIKNRYFGRIKKMDEQKKKRQGNTTF